MRNTLALLFVLALATSTHAQVNLQTGSVDYSLPIFSYSDAKSGLSSAVTVNYYSGGGIRAGELASNIGLGWALNAGGVIERIQNGEPDDQYNPANYGLASDQQIIKREVWAACDNYYPDGFLYTTFSINDIPRQLAIQSRFTSSQTKDYKQSPLALADREQDVFSCSLNGRMVSFVIGKDLTVVCLDDSKLKIVFTVKDMTSSKIRTKINSFTVTDENGVQYLFNELELGEVVDLMETLSDNDGLGLNVQQSRRTGAYVVNKWFLSEIVNPMTNEKIKFTYTNVDLDVITGTSAAYQQMIGEDGESVSVIENHAFIKSKRLLKTEFPDGHYLEFVYDAADRQDVPGDKILSTINLRRKNELVKAFDFYHKYFYRKERIEYTGDPRIDKRFLRLSLEAIVTRGSSGLSIPPYKFDYYTGSESSDNLDMVPSRYTFNIDHWGFYNKNGVTDDGAVGYDKAALKTLLVDPTTYRAPSPNTASLGMLKSVQLPTGGSMTFEYEQNNYLDDNGAEQYAGGVRVKTITLYDGSNTASNQVTDYKYQLANGLSSGWGVETPVYYSERGIDIRKDNSGYNYGGLMLRDHSSLARMKGQKDAIETAASLVIPNPLLQFIFSLLLNFVMPVIDNWFDPWDYVSVGSYSLTALNASNPSPYLYSRAEVKVSSVANSGRTVTEFSKPASSAEILPNSFPYSQKQRAESWKYGLPLYNYVYNSNGALVNYTENTYDIATTVLDDNFKSCRMEANHFLSNRYDWFTFNNSNVDDNWISREFYHLQKGRVRLIASLQQQYDVSGAHYAETTTHYEYNDANNLVSSTYSENSKGETKGQNIYYPDDYSNVNTVVTTMISNNMIGVPITQVNWMQRTINEPRLLLGASATEFNILPDGRIRPSRQYSSVLQTPITDAITDNADPNNIYGYSFYDNVANYTYNVWSDLIAIQDTKGRVNSKIWGYGNRRVIADIIGAQPTQVVYTSFEKEAYTLALPYIDNPDNLDMGPAVRISYDVSKINNNFSVTGEYNYPIENQVSFPMRFEKPSLLTVWGTEGNIYLRGMPPSRTGPTIKGWTYYEFDIAENESNIQLTGGHGVFVDELRVYPKGAKMTTYTYNPSIGKTDECDLNNRITYFEYDGLNRLFKVKDEKRNLIKTYEYHYKTN